MSNSRWPDLGNPCYLDAVTRVIRSGVLTEGPETAGLERDVASHLHLDGRRVSALNGGTAAIEAVLRAMGVKEGWTVGVPMLTFVGSAIPVRNVGADVCWVDVDPQTYNVTPELARAAGLDPEDGRTVLIAVDLHGLPAPIPDLIRDGWADRLLEDACQAWGATLGGVPAGALGYQSALSLNRTKTVQGGEGGIAVTRAAHQSAVVRAFRKFGIGDEEAGGGVAYQPGGNFKITELSAAVARVSLSGLKDHVMRAASCADLLSAACRASGVIEPPYVPEGASPSWHKFRVRARSQKLRDAAYHQLLDAGVPVSFWQALPLNLHPALMDGDANDDTEAFRALSETFLIGTEERPLCTWKVNEVVDWCEVIGNLKVKEEAAA